MMNQIIYGIICHQFESYQSHMEFRNSFNMMRSEGLWVRSERVLLIDLQVANWRNLVLTRKIQKNWTLIKKELEPIGSAVAAVVLVVQFLAAAVSPAHVGPARNP